MVGRKLDAQTAERAVLGSAILGGGGGGRMETGIRLGQMAVELGDASLLDLDDLPPDADIVAVATLDDSFPKQASYRLSYHNRAIDLLELNTGTEFAGLANVGGGALDMMAGWGQAALLGIPLVDIAFDRRVHPYALKGFIDLLAASIPVIPLTVVGCDGRDDERLEMFLRGSPQSVMRLLRGLTASGGSYALSIGPLPRGWAQEQADRHPISRAIEVGQVLLRAAGDGGRMAASAVSQVLAGEVILFGTVTGVTWKTVDDAACGTLLLWDEARRPVELTYWHRYVALDVAGQRMAAFPDLIITLGARGTPLHAQELTEGQDVYIVVAPAAKSTPMVAALRQTSYFESDGVPGNLAKHSHSCGEGREVEPARSTY